MRLPDYHTHTARCGHARGTPAEYVEAARPPGCWPSASPITCRSCPMPDPELSMEACELGDYVGEVRSSRPPSPGSFCWASRPTTGRRPSPRSAPCSRSIPSTTSSARSTIWATGGSTTPVQIDGYSSREIDDVWVEYFELVGEAAESGLFTILGHLDLVKKFGYRPTRALDVELDRLLGRICQAQGWPWR